MTTKNTPPSPLQLSMSEIFTNVELMVLYGMDLNFIKMKIFNMELIRPLKNKNLNYLCV